MHDDIGQLVLKGKTILSYDAGHPQRHDVPMDARTAATTFKEEFARRVKQARLDAKYTQAGIAELLGIKQDKYNKYENRSFMPHQYIMKFCLACGITIDWLYTGRQIGRRAKPRALRLYSSQ